MFGYGFRVAESTARCCAENTPDDRRDNADAHGCCRDCHGTRASVSLFKPMASYESAIYGASFDYLPRYGVVGELSWWE
jgi:hypothetical protein